MFNNTEWQKEHKADIAATEQNNKQNTIIRRQAHDSLGFSDRCALSDQFYNLAVSTVVILIKESIQNVKTASIKGITSQLQNGILHKSGLLNKRNYGSA